MAESDPSLRPIFLGALRVLEDKENPDRLCLAAHGLREFMNRLPLALRLDWAANTERTHDRLDPLVQAWQKALRSSACKKQASWEGLIDGALVSLLQTLAAFMQWYDEHKPRRRQEVGRLLKTLDNSNRYVPPALAKHSVESWMDIRSFFSNYAHHPAETVEEEVFNGWLDGLERLLAEQLFPRTFDEFAEIDAAIAEVER